MSHEPTNWKDELVEHPHRYSLAHNPDGTITLTPEPGIVIQEGTPVNAANLNKIEQGLVSHMADTMPHRFIDGGKTYRWGFRTVNGQPQFIYEEVVG